MPNIIMADAKGGGPPVARKLGTITLNNSTSGFLEIPSNIVDVCGIFLLHIQVTAGDDNTGIYINRDTASAYRVSKFSAAVAADLKSFIGSIPDLTVDGITFNATQVSFPAFVAASSGKIEKIIIKGSNLTGTVDVWGWY